MSRTYWPASDRADRMQRDGHPVSAAYVCSYDGCARFDPDRGGCVPPIIGDWFCRLHLARALEERTERAP